MSGHDFLSPETEVDPIKSIRSLMQYAYADGYGEMPEGEDAEFGIETLIVRDELRAAIESQSRRIAELEGRLAIVERCVFCDGPTHSVCVGKCSESMPIGDYI